MRVDHVPHHAQADAGAAHLRVNGAPSAVERLEDVRQIGGVDAQPAVGHANLHARRVAALEVRADVDSRAGWTVLERVADDVLHGRPKGVDVA